MLLSCSYTRTCCRSATFDAETQFWAHGSGDTWPTTWAQDGRVLGWCCDNSNSGAFSPMSLYQVRMDNTSGAPDPVLVAADPIEYGRLCAPLGPTGPYPNINVKPGTLLAINGTLFSS